MALRKLNDEEKQELLKIMGIKKEVYALQDEARKKQEEFQALLTGLFDKPAGANITYDELIEALI